MLDNTNDRKVMSPEQLEGIVPMGQQLTFIARALRDRIPTIQIRHANREIAKELDQRRSRERVRGLTHVATGASRRRLPAIFVQSKAEGSLLCFSGACAVDPPPPRPPPWRGV